MHVNSQVVLVAHSVQQQWVLESPGARCIRIHGERCLWAGRGGGGGGGGGGGRSDCYNTVASFPVPRPAFRRCRFTVLSSDEKLGVGLGTRLIIQQLVMRFC